ncbi:MAG TPA: sulfite exporter TauE/SafE family protein, partial [Candidatus Dojkabacteria bacterium]|nr:sulfite exporter TauE/SafE family protein [Candidatus Dojkabacteria bacterium]
MPINAPLLIVLSTILAYFLKVIAGFGASLILVPILSSSLDMKTATILACLGDIFSSGIIFKKFIKQVKWRVVFKVGIGLFIGTFIGVSLFTRIDAEILKKMFGLFILIYVALQVFDSLVLKKSRRIPLTTAPIWGLFAGITGGVFNINGPLLVIFMNNSLKNKNEIRANLMALFFIDSI